MQLVAHRLSTGIAVLFLVGFLVAQLAPSAATSDEELRQLEKTWAQAVTQRDFAKLEQLLHDQLIYAHSTGVVEDKATYIGRLRTEAARYDLIDYQQMTVRVFKDAAVVHSRIRMKGAADGRPFDNILMQLHLWVKEGNQWKLAAHQTTRLQQ